MVAAQPSVANTGEVGAGLVASAVLGFPDVRGRLGSGGLPWTPRLGCGTHASLLSDGAGRVLWDPGRPLLSACTIGSGTAACES